jgi:hypothetical protein
MKKDSFWLHYITEENSELTALYRQTSATEVAALIDCKSFFWCLCLGTHFTLVLGVTASGN